MALKSIFTGRNNAALSESTATPIIIVKITILNISAFTIDAKGFSGSRFEMASGIFSSPKESSVSSVEVVIISLCSDSDC
mgnify:CR=1 FL=1